MSIRGIFMLNECTNIEGNWMYINNCNEFVRFEITQQLLSEVITYNVSFNRLMCIKDYYKRAKSGRFEAQYMNTKLQFKYNEYQLMANIINLQGIQAFETFLWNNIRLYYGEVHNKIQMNQPCIFQINVDKEIDSCSIFNINNGREVLGDDLLQYLGIFGDKKEWINEQQRIINSLIINAY